MKPFKEKQAATILIVDDQPANLGVLEHVVSLCDNDDDNSLGFLPPLLSIRQDVTSFILPSQKYTLVDTSSSGSS